MTNTEFPHIPYQTLVDLALGELPDGEPPQTRSHLETCELCGAELTRLAQLTELMRGDASENAPQYLVLQAVREFERYRPNVQAVQTVASSVARRIIAVLQFDSATMKPAFGVRSGQPAASRQLVFSADEFDLDLRVTAGGGENYLLSGQVLGLNIGTIELLDNSGTITATYLNELGEFNLGVVPTAVYTIKLRSGEVEVEFENVLAVTAS